MVRVSNTAYDGVFSAGRLAIIETRNRLGGETVECFSMTRRSTNYGTTRYRRILGVLQLLLAARLRLLAIKHARGIVGA